MPVHAFMFQAAKVQRHVDQYGTKLDARTLEILRELVDNDIQGFLPILAEFRKHAKDAVPEAEAELAAVRKLRASLEN